MKITGMIVKNYKCINFNFRIPAQALILGITSHGLWHVLTTSGWELGKEVAPIMYAHYTPIVKILANRFGMPGESEGLDSFLQYINGSSL